MKKQLISVVLTASVSFGVSAEACKSSSQLHQEKLARYSMPAFPSLLEDCGLNSILDSFAGKLFSKVKLPDFGNFCGYSAKDIAGWYGVDVPDSVGGGAEYKFDTAAPGDLLNGGNLFEVNGGADFELNVE